MNWLTLEINPPNKIEPLVAKKESKFGCGAQYQVFELDKDIHNVDELTLFIQSEGFTHYKYLENFDTDKCKGCKSVFDVKELCGDGYCESCQYDKEMKDE